MTSLFGSVNYGFGKITHMEGELTLEDSIGQQIDLLREYLLQVHYEGGRYILDVGWYPSFDPSGEFIVVVIENYNWDTPRYRHHTASLSDLKDALRKAVLMIAKST